MKQALDEDLCKKYPKIFRDRYADMRTTAMCWGFECGEGWYNIIDKLCANIQSHIDWKRKQRTRDLKFNRALKKALAGDKSSLIKYHSHKGSISEYAMQCVEEEIAAAKFTDVTPKVNQVVAVQVKEKFGGLRFYYDGGDEYISGLVSMAESMSYITCEVCSNPAAKATNSGWIVTMCQPCLDSREERRQKELDEYNANHKEAYKKLEKGN